MLIYNYTLIKQMAEIEVQTRKWGNSLGIAIPKKIIEEEFLHENQKIIIEIKRVADIRTFFNSMKFTKSTQQLKDEMRDGWG